jgi:hypothetical protein
MIAIVQGPALIESGCALLRMPLLNSLAWHVFFGRGSFPDIDLHVAPQPVMSSG